MSNTVTIALVVLAVAASLYLAVFSDDFVPSSVKGKRVLVTGSSAGIGEQIAYEYSKLGARVLVTARREKRLQEVVKKCTELGAKEARYVVADLAKSEDRAKLIDQATVLFGGLDHLIVNHVDYQFGPWIGSAENMTTLKFSLEGHFISYVDLASRALSLLTASRGQLGIVNSIAGKFASTHGSIYSANKFALVGFFSALHQELIERNSGVSVTSCILGPIAVQLNRDSGYTYFGLKAADPADTALAIVKGVTTRQYEVYHPVSATIAVWLHKFFPKYVEDHSTQWFSSVSEYF